MSEAFRNDVCRVAVQAHAGRVDLTLPVGIPLTQLIPAVVDIIDTQTGTQHGNHRPAAPADWQLSRVGDRPLHPRLTLREIGIRDGDFLLLTPAGTVLTRPKHDDVFIAVSTSPGCTVWTPTAARMVGAITALWLTGLGVAASLHNASGRWASGDPVIPSVIAGIALTAAVLTRRVYGDALASVTLSVGATTFAAVAGFRAVPGDGAAPRLLLAAAIGTAVSVIAMRSTGCGATPMTAIASFCLLSAAATSGYLTVPMSVSAAGAVLSTASTGLLVLAARLAIWAARLPLPRLYEHGVPAPDGPIASGGATAKAGHAEAILTGLVCGFSASAALASILLLVDGGVGGAVMASTIAVALLLRSRTHVGRAQTAALLAGGTVCLTALFVRAVLLWPPFAHWTGLVAAVAAATALCLGMTLPAASFSPVVRRSAELTEYLVLAAVAPLACSVCGVFGVVRGLHLT
jgi:type VII secretion integral membrane protein EccD